MDYIAISYEVLIIAFVAIALIAAVVIVKVCHKKAIQEKDNVQGLLIKEFKIKIPKLADNFGSIWLISKGKSKDPARVFRILDKIFKYSENAIILNWWTSFCKDYESWEESTYRSKANDFLTLLSQCGLSCGDMQDTAPENFEELYAYTDEIVTGAAIEVVIPYWRYEDRIIEMGFIKGSKNK